MKTYFLIVLSAFMIEGDMVKPGQVVEMTEKEARTMLDRNKVRLATEDDLKEAGVYQGEPHESAQQPQPQAPATPPAAPATEPAAPATTEQAGA